MPELPEVEVTRRGIAPYLEGQIITDVIVRREGLRWPFPERFSDLLRGRTVHGVKRRGKYLLVEFEHGTVLIHLGMSGHVRILSSDTVAKQHDHIDWVMGSRIMRMTDPRRFGAVLWHAGSDGSVYDHWLLRNLGIEPLENRFVAQYMYDQTRSRSAAIKQVLLSGDIVVGVGNIYASESLFQAGIHPMVAARRIGLLRYERLVVAIRDVLSNAIEQGGSTLRDFLGATGQKGYFQQQYYVYDRAGRSCRVCGSLVRQMKQGQRSTFYCVHCQK